MASTSPPLSFAFRGKQIPVTHACCVTRENAAKALASEPFEKWIANTSATRGSKQIEIHGVDIQNVDMFGPRVGFVKINAHCTLTDGTTEHTEHSLPGICFLRGSSVGILVKLRCVDDGRDYSLLVEQPRVPIGEVCTLELPAGMIDPGSGTIGGVAAKEMKEECDLDISEKDLIDLTQLVQSSTKGICPSPGGCDEFIRLMYYERTVTIQELDDMRGRLGGLAEEGEIITLRVVEFDSIWKICSDAKALCALFLLNQLQQCGRLDPKIVLRDGSIFPQMAFGMYKVDNESCEQVVLDAVSAGYRHFDTAAFYGNEEALGKALKKSGVPRKELFITTKVWNDAQRQGPAGVRESFERSLAALDCDYIDLFLIHWPCPGYHVDTYKTMERIQQEAKAKSIGLSNYNEDDYNELSESGIIVPPVVNQLEVSIAMYRPSLIDFFTSKNIAVSAYKALHRGKSLDNPIVVDIAKKHSATPAQVTLRWGLQKGIGIITKTMSLNRMLENRSLMTFTLDKEDIRMLDGITTEEDVAKQIDVERKSKMMY